MMVEACRYEVELETRGEEQEGLLQLALKQQQQQQLLQATAAPLPVWTSQLVIQLLETGSKSTAHQQSQGQQQQFKTKGQGMVVDAGNAKMEFETGEKGWLDDLVVKLNYEPYLSCSI